VIVLPASKERKGRVTGNQFQSEEVDLDESKDLGTTGIPAEAEQQQKMDEQKPLSTDVEVFPIHLSL
jgi:hypothetical protein